MSLQHAANHLAAHGRGPDTELVHMTKREINSLQELAKANGGSLTINPQTGLPEAGFLDNLLPTVIGGAAMFFSGGTINPMTIGMLTGGLQAARTGSLKKGLMAGLGAYGGAGLAGGLMSAGTSAAQNAAIEGAKTTAAETAAQGAQAANPHLMGSEIGREMGQAGFTAGPSMQGITNQAAANATQQAMATPGATMWEGAKSLTGEAGRNAFSNYATGMGSSAGKLGLAAAAPALMSSTTTKQPEIKSDGTPADKMVYNVGREVDAQGNPITPQPDVLGYGNQEFNFGRERSYFPNAGYTTPVVGQKRFAAGGPVEQMSTANAVGANTGYPMADISQTTYATPYQTPTAQNVVAGAQDVAVDPYTGQEQRTVPAPSFRLAAGGEAKEDIGYKGYKKIPVAGSSDTPTPAQNDFARPSGQTPFEALASDAVAYSKVLGGALPGGLVAGLLGNAYVDSRLSDAASKGGYSGMYTGDAFGGSGNTMSEAQTQASIAGTGGGPLSGEAWGGGDSNSSPGGTSDSSGDGSGGEANGGLAPHFPRHMARGGLSAAASHLGDYSDGGRLLRGPGDGVSDSIPAVIGKKRPARLADGEFVVPARIVSELGNGSTEAGARKLYAMLDRVQAARKKSIGKGKVAKNSRADKLLPA